MWLSNPRRISCSSGSSSSSFDLRLGSLAKPRPAGNFRRTPFLPTRGDFSQLTLGCCIRGRFPHKLALNPGAPDASVLPHRDSSTVSNQCQSQSDRHGTRLMARGFVKRSHGVSAIVRNRKQVPSLRSTKQVPSEADRNTPKQEPVCTWRNQRSRNETDRRTKDE